MLARLKKDLDKLKNKEKAKLLAGYFKTGKGEYGEGDIFYGITVPLQRQVAKRYAQLNLKDLQKLIASKIHEYRLTGLLILINQYAKADKAEKEKIVKFYLKNLKHVNNWDLADISAPKILGDYLKDRDNGRAILCRMARSNNPWERRVAVMATFAFIRQDQFGDALKIGEMLLGDRHDLIHKAVGWMLREVGKRDFEKEEEFLRKFCRKMPRVMLRYAIEKFSRKKKDYYYRLR